MKLLFVHSHKFIKFNQKYYTTGQFPYELFKTRYLNNFDKVTICSRLSEITSNANLRQSDGDKVSFKALPNLSVIKGRKKAFKTTKRILTEKIKESDVVVARIPSSHAYLAMKIAMKLKKPIVVEVVGDSFESLWNHGSLKGKLLAPVSAIKYKRIMKQSIYTIYVTEKQLQNKYPSARNAYSINASNVELNQTPQSVLDKSIKREEMRCLQEINIGLIGSYATKYKGIQNGIDLIADLQGRGINANLYILGNGNKEWLIKKAEKLGVINYIKFEGLLPTGNPVLEWLDNLDLYIQPSLTEGLPRSLIEAMSRGLPAIASNVGGIPELIDSKYLHEPNDSNDLIEKVINLIENKEEMINQIENNFTKAQEYNVDVLRKRRDDFWKKVIKKEQLL